MRVVVDTNVVVAALLSPHRPPAQVLRLVLQGDLLALYDDRILAEYEEVLSRPAFDFHGDDVRAVVVAIEWGGEMVFARPLTIELPDPDDLRFVEVAVSGGADAIVTGNSRDYRPVRDTDIQAAVLSPRDLIDRYSRDPA